MGREKHHHEIEFVKWNNPSHVHQYSTETSYNDGHTHFMRGMTSKAMDSADGHFHYYEGVTTFADGHVHRFNGYTGRAIRLPDGRHYHEFGGQTTFDDGHVHYYRGLTTPEIDVS